jgi:hypothetical protein
MLLNVDPGTCNNCPRFIFSPAISEEGVHDISLISQDGNHIGNGLNSVNYFHLIIGTYATCISKGAEDN